MKHIKNKTQKLVLILILSFVGFFSFLSTLMILPGMGIESLTFINSVEKQIKRIMPEGKYVFDPTHPLYEEMMNNVVKNSFKADALSTINYYDSKDYNDHYDAYVEFSNNWYEQHWSQKVKDKEPIDLYDVGLNFIEFDKAIATEYHSFGFVNTGIQWIFRPSGLKEIYSKETYELSLDQQTIWDQEEYDSEINYSGPGLNGIKINSSIGTNIVNNKVWFLNTQIDSVNFALSLTNPFVNKNIDKKEKIRYVTVDDLKAPNFTATLTLLRVSIVLWFLNIIIIPSGITIYFILRKKWTNKD
ncbi:hypothetical protein [Spiroplasma sp. BIUS-1]|uniref:hypothetical protein n=1 Tax=Spiroplasma sp. BIUS-1 TaxID=216964 RepID=UPI0013991C86|nr:hypothetical protein [Spiroplasma sp. BIUS-1]QHX36601.1 hypothetical protein SBIUS_v1c03480 [Spiroplasma sp. BIUS-1]